MRLTARSFTPPSSRCYVSLPAPPVLFFFSRPLFFHFPPPPSSLMSFFFSLRHPSLFFFSPLFCPFAPSLTWQLVSRGVKKKEGLCDANRSNPGITINKTHIWQRQLISQDVDTTQGQQSSSCGEQSSWLWVINPGRTRYLFTCLSGGSAWWSSELKKAKKASTNHLTVSETLHFWDWDSETPWMPLSRSVLFIARTPQPQHSCRETRSSCDKRHDFRRSDRLYLPSKLLHVIN